MRFASCATLTVCVLVVIGASAEDAKPLRVCPISSGFS